LLFPVCVTQHPEALSGGDDRRCAEGDADGDNRNLSSHRPRPEMAASDEWAFAQSVDTFPVVGNGAIAALGGRLLLLEDMSAWHVEPGPEEGTLVMRYEPAPPTNRGRSTRRCTRDSKARSC